MESPQNGIAAQKFAKPDIHPVYTVNNILKTERAINKRVCSKTLDLAEKYIKNGETITTFNKDFMNEMVRADPEKIKATVLLETGMSIGLDTVVKYAEAVRYYKQTDHEDFNKRLLSIEMITKKIMDAVFSGHCNLADIEQSKALLGKFDDTQ